MNSISKILAERIVNSIFKLGEDFGGKEITRIQFMSGHWAVEEHSQGGISRDALITVLAKEIEGGLLTSDPK